MSKHQYIKLSNDYCTLNSLTGMWSLRLPDDFINSRNPDKRIVVMNFMYFPRFNPPTEGIYANLEYTTFHSPTLCDGNFNQDNYICTVCYAYNTVFKTYPIKSNPQYLEFFFRDPDGSIIKTFHIPGANIGANYDYTEKFSIDLELIY